jgi:uncharacterized membrane protein
MGGDMKKIKQFIIKYYDDLLIFAGLVVLIATTFILNTVAGLYSLGAVLLILGLFFALTSGRKG